MLSFPINRLTTYDCLDLDPPSLSLLPPQETMPLAGMLCLRKPHRCSAQISDYEGVRLSRVRESAVGRQEGYGE